MEKETTCSVCRMPLPGIAGSNFTHPDTCPYLNTSYPELCALHDTLYFGNWRKMTANILDVKRAYGKLRRFLLMVKEAAWEENFQPAKLNVKKAFDSLSQAEPDDDPFYSIRYMDQALSYAHHAINDLLHEKGERPHDPADYENFFDITYLPFRDEL
jgi:hypothetical protein